MGQADPDNQRPDKWNSTVITRLKYSMKTKTHIYKFIPFIPESVRCTVVFFQPKLRFSTCARL